jgi:hypothetical protein
MGKGGRKWDWRGRQQPTCTVLRILVKSLHVIVCAMGATNILDKGVIIFYLSDFIKRNLRGSLLGKSR